MKLFKSLNFWVVSTILLLIGYAISCTKTDQVLDSGATSTNELLSLKTSTAPSIDGSIDASWEKATKLNFTATVPDPGNNLFSGYINEGYKVTLRSMYDNDYIYFLAEIVDAEKSVKSAPWYFNPTTKRWAQEPTARTFNSSGVLTREGLSLIHIFLRVHIKGVIMTRIQTSIMKMELTPLKGSVCKVEIRY